MISITVNDVHQRLHSRRRIRAIAVGLLFFAVVALTVLWVYRLVYRPRLTPMLTAAVTDYAWPVEPNAWASEDAARLKSLDRQSLQVVDLSPDWRSRELALKRLDADLASLAASRSLAETVVFYFSLHGVVDSDGRPHLLPADASALDSATWLPLREVLDRIATSLPPQVHKLVLLDSNRTAANWRTGQLHNTFADRLASALDPQRHPNIVIVNSCSPDQSGWSSPGMGGSLFGYFVSRGLGGEADVPPASPEAEQQRRTASPASGIPRTSGRRGNGDGRVSVAELVHYLNRRLEDWCQTHRMPAQRVMQVPEDAADFSLTWALSKHALDQIQQRLPIDTSPSIASTELDTLWRQASELARPALQGIAPETLSEIEHRLLGLEKLASAGRAYDQQAARQLTTLRRRLDTVAKLFEAAQTRRSPVAIRGALRNQPIAALGGSAVPSLQFAATLGGVSADAVQAAEQQWDDLLAGMTTQRLQTTLQLLDKTFTAGNPAQDQTFNDAQFLRLMQRYQTLGHWPRRDPITSTLALRATADRLSVMRLADGSQAIRGMQWVSPLIDQADQHRLLVEDLLLAGQAASAEVIDERLEVAHGAYETASQRLSDVAAAIAVREDAWQRLPYFAEAFAMALPQAQQQADAGAPAAGSAGPDLVSAWVLPGIRDAITLGRQLDAPATGGLQLDSTETAFLATSQRLQATLQHLDTQLDQWISGMASDSGSTNASVTQLRAALAVPWLAWQQRRDLRQVHDRLARSQGVPVDPSPQQSPDSDQIPRGQRDAETGTRAASDPPPASVLDRILSWPIHPAVLISGAETRGDAGPGTPASSDQVVPAESGVARVEQSGYRVREALSRWAPGASNIPGSEQTVERDELLAAARWQRRILPLIATDPRPSPIEILWRDDLQRLLLWHADRQLSEFLGGAAEPGELTRRPAYFDIACTRCLDLIEAIGPAPVALQQPLADVRRRQIVRRLAARSGLSTTVESSPLPRGGNDFSTTVTVRPGDSPTESDEAFPAGRPSVWVQTEQSRWVTQVETFGLPLRQTQTFPLAPSAEPASDTTAAQPMPTPTAADDTLPPRVTAHPDDSPRLTAMTMFRGNEYRQPFVINRLGGTTASYQPHRYGPSTITLLGQRRKRASIMFVLDCSGSMDEPLPSESSSDPAPSRMDSAKSALITMLDELSQQDGTRIGVIFLGHRVAWTRSDPPRISKSPGAPGELPDGLMPSRDVETVLPLGRFDSGRVLQRLDTVRPWGQSPLNLALVEAMRAFAADDADTEKSIIVITDGRDYQFTPSRSDIRQPPRTTHGDVLRVAQEVGVPTYLLGFGLPADQRDAAVAEFQQIAAATGGEATTVEDAAELLRKMRASLAPGTFSVGGLAETSAATLDQRSITASLNGTVTVDRKQTANDRFQLVFESASASIPLAGGEALAIQLSDDGRRFLPIPFDWQFPKPIDLVIGANNQHTPYVLRAHRPQRRADTVTFPVSVQSTSDPVTARPAEAWLVITPTIGGVEQSEHRYWFYDVNYEPNQPVPLLQWDAGRWPADSQSARLEFWCKFERSIPFEEFPLRAVLDQPEDFISRSLTDFPAIHLQISVSDRSAGGDEYLINVIEQYQSPTPDVAQIKVEFRTAEQFHPKRVTHQFDPTHGIASHTFVFDAADAAGIERSQQSRIVLTSRAALQRGALRSRGGQAIDIELYSPGDVITLGPPR